MSHWSRDDASWRKRPSRDTAFYDAVFVESCPRGSGPLPRVFCSIFDCGGRLAAIQGQLSGCLAIIGDAHEGVFV